MSQKQQLLEVYTGKLDKTFPNGFTSWKETYFEVTSFMIERILEDETSDTEINRVKLSQGSTALYFLAEQWADEFENLNIDREWDGEFFEEIEQFCATKNNTQ